MLAGLAIRFAITEFPSAQSQQHSKYDRARTLYFPGYLFTPDENKNNTSATMVTSVHTPSSSCFRKAGESHGLGRQ